MHRKGKVQHTARTETEAGPILYVELLDWIYTIQYTVLAHSIRAGNQSLSLLKTTNVWSTIVNL